MMMMMQTDTNIYIFQCFQLHIVISHPKKFSQNIIKLVLLYLYTKTVKSGMTTK